MKRLGLLFSVVVISILFAACNSGATYAPSPQKQQKTVKPMSLNLGPNVYTTTTNRTLDAYDDSTWHTMGGSYGQVSGGGSGCGKTVCPNAGTLAYMQIICYYQAVTPGIHDPAHDIPLGCDYIDFYGNEVSSTPTNPGFDSGVRGGAGLKGSKTCSNPPEAVGDTFIPWNSNTIVTVTAMNSVYRNGIKIGWIYGGSDGNHYARVDPSFQKPPGQEYNPSYVMGTYFGFSGLPTNVPPDTAVAKIPAGQHLQNGAKSLRCFTNGGDLNG